MQKKERIPTAIVFTAVIICTTLLAYIINQRSFTMDNLLHFTEIERFVNSKTIPVTGASMSGLPAKVPGAMYYYPLMAVYAWSHSFIALRILSIFMGLVFAALFIASIRKFIGNSHAALAAMAVLCNPFFLTAASDFWNANFIFPALILLLAALIRIGTTGTQSWHTAFIIPLAAIMAQIHVATLFIVPPLVMIYLLRHYRTWCWRYLLLGLAGGFLLYLPYLIVEIGNGFANTRLMFAGNAAHRSGILLPQIYAFLIFPTNEITYFLGKGTKTFMDFYFKDNPIGMLQLIANVLSLLISLAGNILAAFCLIPPLRKRLRGYDAPAPLKEGLFLAYTGIAVVIVVFTALNLPKGVWHYYYALYPLSFFPILLLFDFLRAKAPRISKAFAVIVAVNAVTALTVYHRYIELYQKPSNIENSKALARAALADAKGRTFYILNSEYEKYGDDSYISVFGIEHQYQAVARIFLRTNWNEVYNGTEQVTYVVDNVLYPFQRSFWERTQGLLTPIWTSGGVTLYRSKQRIPYQKQ